MSSGRVLVVDDEEDYRGLMTRHLRRKGYDVFEAGDGAEALQVLKREGDIGVLVADLMMPRMDGLELLKRARKDDQYLEVVVISGAGTLESAISSMRMGGAYDYLPKPLDTIEDLSLAVSRAADHRALRIEQERLQAQVASERERLQWVIENTRDALLSSENGRTIALVNPAAGELFHSDSLVGEPALEILPAPVASLLDDWQSFELLRPMVTEVAWPQDRVQMVSLTSSGDRAAGWVMVLREVTELRRLQRLKMRLLAQTAAEVREPLASALAAMVTLNEQPQTVDEQYTSAVQQGVQGLGAIRSWTDQVLSLVEMEARSLAEEKPIPLADIVEQQLAADLPELLEEKEIEVEVELEDRGQFAVQPQLARRLLHHLLKQAAWRAPKGDRLRLALESNERRVRLSLHDGGEPLLPSAGVETFEAYLALENDPAPGIGLSLAMMKSAADALGAHVWLRCDGEQGNALVISLPASGQEA